MNRIIRMSPRSRALTVLVDMDGVIADFEGHWLNVFRERYPDDKYVPLNERKTFYIADQYEEKEKVISILSEDGFYFDLPPIEGACEALKDMSGLDNVQVYICSTPLIGNFASCCREKAAWVIKYLGKDWAKRLILTVDKTVVQGDILIDDKHRITGGMRPSWEHVLFTACHNRHVDVNGRMRLESWKTEHWMPLIERCKKQYLS